jgi:hypothetical protein
MFSDKFTFELQQNFIFFRPYFLLHSFLESMKLPTTTKTSSGFHICDILELNKEKQPKKDRSGSAIDDVKSIESEEADEDELKKCEKSERSSRKHRRTSSPTSQHEISTESQSSEETRSPAKHQKDDLDSSTNHQHHQHLLSETMHQYPQLFHNHPAMRPWFNHNGEFPLQINDAH